MKNDLLNDNTQRSTQILEMISTKIACSIESNHSLLSIESQEYLYHVDKIASEDASQQEKSNSSKTIKLIIRESLCITTYIDNERSTQTHRHHQDRVKYNLQANIDMSRVIDQKDIMFDVSENEQDSQSQCHH